MNMSICEGSSITIKPEILKHHRCPTGRVDNRVAKVQAVFADGSIRTDRDLVGCMWWNIEDVQLAHRFDIGSLVQYNGKNTEERGIRLFVVEHTRNSMGELTYTLSNTKDGSEDGLCVSGYPEDDLEEIETHDH